MLRFKTQDKYRQFSPILLFVYASNCCRAKREIGNLNH